MTNIYFVRHAQSDTTVQDDSSRPLTKKGMEDCALVTQYLLDKGIAVVASSPYKRSRDTVNGIAQAMGLEILCMDGFAERRISDGWIDDFASYAQRQWSDFSYKLSNGESLKEVQLRNINALNDLLERHVNQNIAVGTHGTALSTIIHFYNKSFNYDHFRKIVDLMPWIVHFTFDGRQCINMNSINVFQHRQIL